MNTFSTLDIVFLFYFIVVAGYGLWVYRRKKSAFRPRPRTTTSWPKAR
jgi:amino acid transporter